ncbi:WXG100 family type VII secretion target [Kitasatospora sp. NPDC057198]|uniref:WXG100 family type VII secretion target n=1 Tax=Kitasatospora sp. NPDC057198 TaxID=3346046 RepID=UPI00362CCF38
MRNPVTMDFGQAGDAYKWTRDRVDAVTAPLPDLSNPVSEGLDAGLDHIVKAALDATGLMGMLEKVTGNLPALTAAAREWQEQAREMRAVAADLRAGAAPLAEDWHGDASASFAAYMGEVVEGIDATAADMEQVAQIIGQAAAECRLAEELVIGIIREAIETLIVSLAVMVVIDIVTVGLATIVEALVAEAEIAVFIARVEKVSVDLAKALRTLQKAVRELRTVERNRKGLQKATEAAKAVRKFGKSPLKAGWGVLKNADDLPMAERLVRAGVQIGVKEVFSPVKGGTKAVIGAGLGAGDFTGLIGDALDEDRNVDTVTGALDGPEHQQPYRVPRTRIQEAFG